MNDLDRLRAKIERRGKIPYVGAQEKPTRRRTKLGLVEDRIKLVRMRAHDLRDDITPLRAAVEAGSYITQEGQDKLALLVRKELELKRHRLFQLEKQIEELERQADLLRQQGERDKKQ